MAAGAWANLSDLTARCTMVPLDCLHVLYRLKIAYCFYLILFFAIGRAGGQVEIRRWKYAIDPPPPNYLKEVIARGVKNWPTWAGAIAAGYMGGVGDVLANHHSSSVWANVPPTSFFGRESWKRKHKWSADGEIIGPAFPGSRDVFVAYTDAWHLSNTLERGAIGISWTFHKKGDKLWQVLLDIATYSCFYGAGHTLAKKTLTR